MAALLGGCADDLGSVARRQAISAQSIVRLSDGFAVAARRAGGGVEVVAFAEVTGGGWAAEVIAGGRDGEMTAHLVTAGGETGPKWNSFFFGTAQAGRQSDRRRWLRRDGRPGGRRCMGNGIP